MVAAINTTLNTWLKDRLERRIAATRRREAERETYRRYAEPLTEAASALFWRLREIFEVPGGGYYLERGGGETPFESYKATSTRFRIAALLGWIAALKRELLLSDATTDPSVEALRSVVAGVEASLADGGHVELDRADVVLEALGLTRAGDAEMARLGRQINSTLKRSLHWAGASAIGDLDPSAGAALVATVKELVRVSCHAQSAVPASSDDALLAALDVREAWIYRDWQEAIGEAMLEPAVGNARSFDVKGYRGFVRMTETPEPFDGPWFGRLNELTSDLDIAADIRLDARIRQLRGVLVAVARLIQEFHAVEPGQSSVFPSTVDAVMATLGSSGA